MQVMNKNYLLHIAESKAQYHNKRAKMRFEEKIKIIVELQKIEQEFIQSNMNRNSKNKLKRVWKIHE